MKREYFYPDVNDKITIALIKEKEPFQGYWEKSENEILRLIKELIKKRSIRSTNSWLLDAGCGTGRLLPEFQQYFSHILAVDPDSTQIEKAGKLARDKEFSDKVIFKVSLVEQLDWEKESIDVILCSHIIQHVHTETISKILHKFNEILKQDGLLFILTTHSRNDFDYYVKGYLKNSKSIEEKIREEKFNSLINIEQNVLPLHFFSIKNVKTILKNSGFVLLDYRSFHVLGKLTFLDKITNRDHLVNTFECLKTRFGRDILIISQKLVK